MEINVDDLLEKLILEVRRGQKLHSGGFLKPYKLVEYF